MLHKALAVDVTNKIIVYRAWLKTKLWNDRGKQKKGRTIVNNNWNKLVVWNDLIAKIFNEVIRTRAKIEFCGRQ